jgi:hypothetical protein
MAEMIAFFQSGPKFKMLSPISLRKCPLTRPMSRTAQARFFAKWCCLLRYLKLQQIVLAKLVFHRRGVLCSVSSYGIGYSCSR